MFITIKKKHIIITLAIIFGLIVVFAGVYGIRSATAIRPYRDMTVVIDAGHGGRDGGVTGVNTGIRESELNLAIARSLRHFFVLHGYNVVMTRESQAGLYGNAPQGHRKAADFERRREIIERTSPDLVISIHLNSFPLPSVRGAHVFFAPNAHEGTQAIAASIQNSLNNNLEASSRRAARGDYFIIQCNRFPAVLVEGGYLTSPEDESLLVTAAYQERLAFAIFAGVHTMVENGQWPF